MDLVLDTSVWRESARDRRWLRRIAASSHRILAPSEATQELVVAAIGTQSEVAFSETRLACVLIERYAAECLEPFPWHLARHLGFDPGPRVDAHHVHEWIAGIRSLRDLQQGRLAPAWAGGGRQADIPRWPAALREEKRRWLDSLSASLHSGLPGLIDARKRMAPVEVKADQYDRLKEELWVDRRALAKLEVAKMYETLDELPRLDGSQLAAAENSTLTQLEVYVAMQIEAILDLFDGPHNRYDRKLDFSENDWIDLAQMRYVQPGGAWVTLDRRWLSVARRAGQEQNVIDTNAL